MEGRTDQRFKGNVNEWEKTKGMKTFSSLDFWSSKIMEFKTVRTVLKANLI